MGLRSNNRLQRRALGTVLRPPVTRSTLGRYKAGDPERVARR